MAGLLDSDWVNCPADVAHLREARSPRPGRATRPRRGVPLQDGPSRRWLREKRVRDHGSRLKAPKKPAEASNNSTGGERRWTRVEELNRR